MTTVSSGSYLRVYSRPPEAALHLVCFPHAGGSAAAYRDWAPLLPASVRLTAIQYSGRQDRINDVVPASMHELADEIWRALSGHAGPMLLFGHSFGATVAFEVARRLQQRDPGQVLHLVASGRPGPRAQPRTAKHLLGDDELWADMLRLGGTDGELASLPALRELVLPGLRQDYYIIETYEPAPDATVSCPVTVFLGADDAEVELAQAQAWALSTTGAFRLRVFDGDHFYLSARPARVVSEVLSLVPAVR
ncbi:alpha/beta fold hydrolase [Amorphoplanes nipponensis]|uniref:Thioesterase n=1 Tax=Actinoplanes nipponensis TaxID=135950 RepID=A0A919JM45_9ACTN|nr:thioesterase [Actinoplanes nipponensis]GIE51691.1 thioesterase [Actinoplanes nipponensis]